MMRHVAFGAVLSLYIVVVGQSWAVHTSALMVALWARQKGDLASDREDSRSGGA